MSMYRNKLDEIENKLQKAHDLLLYNNDLESKEALGFIVEVLAMLEEKA